MAFKLAIVLYSYDKRIDRQQLLYKLCYRQISRIPNIRVFVTRSERDQSDLLPGVEPILLDVPEGYEYLPDKTIAMLKWLVEHTDCDAVVKCDDDVWLDPSRIDLLERTASSIDYGAHQILNLRPGVPDYHLGRCSDPILNQSPMSVAWAPQNLLYAQGACYSLSRDAMRAILNQLKASGFDPAEARQRFDIRGCAEDILVGSLLHDCGILPTVAFRLPFSYSGCDLLKATIYERLGNLSTLTRQGRWMGFITSNHLPYFWELQVMKLILRTNGVIKLLKKTSGVNCFTKNKPVINDMETNACEIGVDQCPLT